MFSRLHEIVMERIASPESERASSWLAADHHARVTPGFLISYTRFAPAALGQLWNETGISCSLLFAGFGALCSSRIHLRDRHRQASAIAQANATDFHRSFSRLASIS